jgi:hypothetical protein
MAIRFELEQLIASSPERVYAALTHLDGMRSWLPNLVRVERLAADASGGATRWRETRRVNGREASEDLELVDAHAPRRLTVRIDGRMGSWGRGEYLFRYEIDPLPGADDGTRLVMRGEISRFGLLFGLLARLFLPSFRKSCATDLRALAAHLAARSTVHA